MQDDLEDTVVADQSRRARPNVIDGSPPPANVMDSDDTIIVQRPSLRPPRMQSAPVQAPDRSELSVLLPEPLPEPSVLSPDSDDGDAAQPAIFDLVEPPLAYRVLSSTAGAPTISSVTEGPPAAVPGNADADAAAHYRFRIADTVVGLDKTAFIGRKPGRPRVLRDESLRLVHVPSVHQEVSKTHLEVRQRGASVIVTDLGSTNGSVVNIPGSAPRTLRPGESMVVTPGTLVDIGDGNLVEILPIQRS